MFSVFLKAHSFGLKRKKYHLLHNFVNKFTFKKLFADVTFCVQPCNVLKLNYIDSKKSANGWNTNINVLGTMWGPSKICVEWCFGHAIYFVLHLFKKLTVAVFTCRFLYLIETVTPVHFPPYFLGNPRQVLSAS